MPLAGASLAGPVDAAEPIRVTVLVRRRPGAPEIDTTALGSVPPAERRHASLEEFAATWGADPRDLGRVEEFARAHALAPIQSSVDRRTVVLIGRTADFSDAFGAELNRYEHSKGSHRGREGPVWVPADLGDVVEGVFGLDDRLQYEPRIRPRRRGGSLNALQVAELYRFPSGLNGRGQYIGILSLNGGYKMADLHAYFRRLGLRVPHLTEIGIDGAHNDPNGSPEVKLDIEIAGTVAPGAQIVVYFAPGSDQGVIDALGRAVHDGLCSIISISEGGPESSFTPQTIRAIDELLKDAASKGITVCVATGDHGSADGVADGKAHVDFPASSPHALACGGTHLKGSGKTIASEVVWNDDDGATGGGISDVFGLPRWQRHAHVPHSVNPDKRVGRGVPDVAGDASGDYQARIPALVAGGTSAVAPLWAGLIARINEGLGHRVGYLNPYLYEHEATRHAFHDITSGTNAVPGTPGYAAGPGWDACTGLGSPKGHALMAALADKHGP